VSFVKYNGEVVMFDLVTVIVRPWSWNTKFHVTPGD